MRYTSYWGIGLLLITEGCSTAKYQLEDGHYRSSQGELDVEVLNDTVRTRGSDGLVTAYPPFTTVAAPPSLHLDHPSLDVDVLTILLKYRPAEGDLQPQLQPQLGAALYIGYRIDRYVLNYRVSPFGTSVRHTGHFGISLGGFAGLGATPVNPWVTSYRVNEEYDGVALSHGVSLIGAVERFTIGVALGRDALLNSHSRVWLYEGQPWIGLVLGLNLN